jgi:hypothetical protein
LINVNYKNSYDSGYSIAGSNVYEIVKSEYSDAMRNQASRINIFIQIPPFKLCANSYNIGFFYWETVDFPSDWKHSILQLDEFWSPCELVTRNLIRLGFSGKIFHVPTPIKTYNCIEDVGFRHSDGCLNKETFKFYSIFHWNFRKGYDLLVEAYLRAFSEEDVALVVKTNSASPVVKEFSSLVRRSKSKIGEKVFPKIFFTEHMLCYDDILRIHGECDCFVLPHRGEGWGIPIHEALNSYNPVITTKFGGITDYLDSENSYPIDYTMSMCKNMENWGSLYEGKTWAEPSIESIIFNMKDAFYNKDSFREKQLRSKIVANRLSYDNITKIIISRLGAICEDIGLV